MRGDFLHNEILVECPARALERLGAGIRREYPVRRGRHPRFVDSCAELNGRRIILEGESRFARVPNDIRKAETLRAHALFIVTPTSRIARIFHQRLSRMATPRDLKIVVLSVGAVLQVFTNKSHLMSLLNVRETLIHKFPCVPISDERK